MTCTFPDLADWGGLIPGEVEEVAAERAEAIAWSTMVGLVAGRVSLCPITVRPTGITGAGSASTSVTDVSAVAVDTALLALERPVGRIVSVTQFGVPFTGYTVEGSNLRRLDGNPWPTNDDMTLPFGHGALEVTYYRGKYPGPAFIWATGQLAAEFYLATVDVKGKKCRLPDQVTAVTRQGITYEVNAGVFGDGLTGIREIDAVIRMYNPNVLRQAALVASADSIVRAPIRIA